MKIKRRKNRLTLGELIVRVYDVCGQRKGRGIMRLAMKANLIYFHGQHRFLIARHQEPCP